MWYTLKIFSRHALAELSAEWRGSQSHMLSAAQALDLSAHIERSELSHSAQICVCFETALPASYLWRHTWRGETLTDVVRQRAMTLFGRYRVWDTEHNNGLLLYILGAERRMVVLADRGFNGKVSPEQWQNTTDTLSAAFKLGNYKSGLQAAMQSVHEVCQAQFAYPAAENGAAIASRPNELSNTVIRL